MKMKRILTIGFAVACAFQLRADYSYLLWEIVQPAGGSEKIEFDYARLYAQTASGDGRSVYTVNPETGLATGGQEFYSDLESNPGGIGFVAPLWAAIELVGEDRIGEGWNLYALLFDEQGAQVGRSNPYLIGYGAFGKNLVDDFGTTPSGGALSVGVVPEPTSGLLFLLGVASLALRRKVREV